MTSNEYQHSKEQITTENIPPMDSMEIPMDISKELTELLQKKNTNMQNQNSTLPKPKWPLTSSRAAHQDSDVFIARANNPFGHSTKWKWSNATTNLIGESNNRSKRGALLLYSMVKCSTGCDPLVYKGYGCYCGFLGSGRTLDGIDR